MLSNLASTLRKGSQPLILTSTRLEDNFTKNKINLSIFKELKEGEKLGKIIDDEGKPNFAASSMPHFPAAQHLTQNCFAFNTRENNKSTKISPK